MINNHIVTSNHKKRPETTASHSQSYTAEQKTPICRMDSRSSLKFIAWSSPFEKPPLHGNILQQNNHDQTQPPETSLFTKNSKMIFPIMAIYLAHIILNVLRSLTWLYTRKFCTRKEKNKDSHIFTRPNCM